ncbi:hypothetical protein [Chachezhania antarctica]|uniref:hypothetical protein n=1 Tax=Chachezhania antarctica TaxID=2340860 RepID=UPI0013CE6C1E|nr:hypothetical protein [Chachezhania antarctica]
MEALSKLLAQKADIGPDRARDAVIFPFWYDGEKWLENKLLRLENGSDNFFSLLTSAQGKAACR